MNILLPTIGSRGDVQPFIALAQALQRAGHGVTLASHPHMRSLVETHGVRFSPFGPDVDMAEQAASIRKQSSNDLAALRQIMRFSFELLEASHADLLPLCHLVDLLGIFTQSAAGRNEADLLGLPYFSVTLMPWAIPYDDPSRPVLMRLLYGAIDSFAGQLTTRPLNSLWRKYGLPPLGPQGFASTKLNLIPVSIHVYAPIAQWQPYHHMTGYWFADPPEDWQPPADLLRFLQAGQPPVLISLGSLVVSEVDDREAASLFVNALVKTGTRAVVQGWQSTLQQITLPDSIYLADPVPHSWLLPQCRAMVHHGGFGTTAAGLKAGIPSLIIPHLADQFYWADLLFKLGAAPKPIRRAKLTDKTLIAGLMQLYDDVPLAQAVAALGDKIRSENRLEKAIDLIQSTFDSG